MTVKRYGRGAGASSVGKPALHPATVDLTGKAYEYVSLLILDFSLRVGSLIFYSITNLDWLRIIMLINTKLHGY